MYHIMCRGNHKGIIFREEEDYRTFLYFIKEAQRRYPFRLHSYCLMTNHVHLQLETLEKEIWFIMKYICMFYTKYFNTKYHLVGHLFQGRYHAVLIEDDSYFLQISRYIHLNPVKAYMVEKPADYTWSSYKAFLGECNNSLIITDKTLGFFEDYSRILYQGYVEYTTHTDGKEKEIQESMGENEQGFPW